MRTSKTMLAGVVAPILAAAQTLFASVWYVSPGGSNANTGKDWAHPLQTIASALSHSKAGDEIWVRLGTYPETISFTRRSLYGGFIGNENSPAERTNLDPGKDITLSTIDAQTKGRCVGMTGFAEDSVLDGFNVINGRAPEAAGILVTGGTVANCRVSYNIAQGVSTALGGGIQIDKRKASVVVMNTHVVNNQAIGSDASGGGIKNGGGDVRGCAISFNQVVGANGQGGGMFTSGTVERCQVFHNKAQSGAGVLNLGLLQDCTVYSNLSSGDGGGIHNGGQGRVNRCTVYDNVANGNGGGIFSEGLMVSDCLAHDNRAQEGGGIYRAGLGDVWNSMIYANQALGDGGGLCNIDSAGMVANCTLTANTAAGRGDGLFNSSGTVCNTIAWNNNGMDIESEQAGMGGLIEYCCIGAYSAELGVGNLFVDPRFVAPEDQNFRLQRDSPCVDTGRLVLGMTEDFEGGIRPYDGDGLGAGLTGDGSDFDIGADEYQPPGAPVLLSADDELNLNGSVRLDWTNGFAPPEQFLGLGFDLYSDDWIHQLDGSPWHAFDFTQRSGLIGLQFSGAYHFWIGNQYSDGAWFPCLNPWTGIVYGGAPHAPADVTAEQLGGLNVRLHWKPEIFGTWHYQIIAFDAVAATWVKTHGPSGNRLWHFVMYPYADSADMTADLTVPLAGAYWLFIRGMAWDSVTASDFSYAFVIAE